MTKTLKLLGSAAALSVAALAVTSPAVAQRGAAPASASSYGVLNAEEAVETSAAMNTARTQVQSTYATQIQAYQTRAAALQAELAPLRTAAETEAARNPRNNQAYTAAVQAYQTKVQSAQAELGQLSAPFELAVQYAREQVALKLRDAVTAATAARRVNMVLTEQAVAWNDPSVDMTAAVTAELNRLIPSAQITPPQGYQPGDLTRQAAAAAQQAQQPAAAQPQSR